MKKVVPIFFPAAGNLITARHALPAELCIVRVHRNLQVRAFHTGIVKFALKFSPLPQEIYNALRKVTKATTGGKELTDASLQAVKAGATTTRFESKLRASETIKPMEWSISLVGAFDPEI